jgi:hypothetical protein
VRHTDFVPHLVVIVGPIASGKTTVADLLGGRLRDGGREVAVLDLDDAVEASGTWANLTPDRLRLVQLAYGKHVAAWLEQGFDVIAHGPLFEPLALEAVLDHVPCGTAISHVRLLATYEVALERVNADPDRQVSKDPGFLRMAYQRIEPLLDALPAARWTFDTTSMSSAEIVDELTAALLG